MTGTSRPTWVRWAAPVALALLLGVPMGAVGSSPSGGSVAPVRAVPSPVVSHDVPYLTTTVAYDSSVDGFHLSYTEAVPANYSATHTYPLGIELHGLAGTEITPMPGGWPTEVNNTTIQAAIDAGFLLIIPNTRTGAGWYTDSPYTGPQQQDIFDAIHAEQARRNVGSLYLYGFSMGGIGSLAIGLSHPGMFAGLGAVAMFSDMYQMIAYFQSNGQLGVIDAFLRPVNGTSPANSTEAQAFTTRLSALRYEARNASGTRMYFTDGAEDILSSNNVTQWAYQQGNDSVLHTTCAIAAALNQPAGCTTPFAGLAASDPANFTYRYVFEPDGVHAYGQLNASDLYGFFTGQQAAGTYWGDFPSPTPALPPQPLVTVATAPYGCGTITYDARLVPTGSYVSSVGGHPLDFASCPGEVLTGVRTAGAVSYDAANATLQVAGSGSAVGVYSVPVYTVTIDSNAPCAVEVNGRFLGNDSTIALTAGVYPIAVPACAMYSFAAWRTTGSLNVTGTGTAATLNVSGNGTLTATFTGGPPPPPVAVTFLLDPPSCPALVLNGTRVASGSVVDLAAGSYPLQALDCPGYAFQGWTATEGVSVTGTGALAVLIVNGTGSITAVYQAGGPAVFTLNIVVSPASCGSVVQIDGVWYADGWAAYLPAQNYTLSTGACDAGPLISWNVTGAVAAGGGVLQVSGNGSLTAWFGNRSTNTTPPVSNDSGGLPIIDLVPVFVIAVAAVLVAAIVLGRRSAARRPPQGRPGRGDGPPPRR